MGSQNKHGALMSYSSYQSSYGLPLAASHYGSQTPHGVPGSSWSDFPTTSVAHTPILPRAKSSCAERWATWERRWGAIFRGGPVPGVPSGQLYEGGAFAGYGLSLMSDQMARSVARMQYETLMRECPRSPRFPEPGTAPRPLPSTVTAGPARIPWWGWLLGGGLAVLLVTRGRG